MNVLIYDIETMQELFLIGIYNPETKDYVEFEVSKHGNQLDGFIRFTEQHAEHYWVGYNNLRFDSQIIEWILRNHDHWHEYSALELTAKIAQKAADVIDDANYDVFPEFREEWMTLKQIDLFKVNHYDNKNRMVSLKRLEFEMGLTKREYFTAKAMQGLLSNPEWMKEYKGEKYLMQSDIVADVAIRTADTILAKLSIEDGQ